jgi:hypothetical protein
VRAAESFGVFIDNNRSTLLSLASPDSLPLRLLERLGPVLRDPRCAWLLWTDTAVGKLHLNYPAYRLRSPRFETYARALRRKLEALVGVEYVDEHVERHARASYHLYATRFGLALFEYRRRAPRGGITKKGTR